MKTPEQHLETLELLCAYRPMAEGGSAMRDKLLGWYQPKNQDMDVIATAIVNVADALNPSCPFPIDDAVYCYMTGTSMHEWIPALAKAIKDLGFSIQPIKEEQQCYRRA